MVRIYTPPIKLSQRRFTTAMKSDSTDLLEKEEVGQPFNWEGDWWVVTSYFKASRKRWAIIYQLIPLVDWPEEKETFVYGCFDEDWIQRRAATGSFWSGCVVQINGAPERGQFVLGPCLTVYPEGSVAPGQQGDH